MYSFSYTPRFLRSIKRCKQQGKDLSLLWDTIQQLLSDGKLPASYQTHELQDEYAGYLECHMEDDWLLIWKQNDNKLTFVFYDTGSHRELFHKKMYVEKRK